MEADYLSIDKIEGTDGMILYYASFEDGSSISYKTKEDILMSDWEWKASLIKD